ncbi:DUF4254 domain-containing protein [Jiulongibacter sediminis]|uniref:DUF4254 domain-containing protein n=1 Tax=Jiulongibacter sediminis TaxID=1605367 RepID=A0A0P7C3C4_9BACT|nr:DUF4254 domain-containing protein [Jiulongibacter sediminis]KPM49137.1 hypothetical protein AFM12_00350 [Jiulongibacter sediminis]TBX26193.1 hypothetical protein TK44_00350 [Jiulongibacter sediminis]
MNLLSAKEIISIFRKAIDDYHLQDHVNASLTNPFDQNSFEGLLYVKNWIDTVQWHLEDIIRRDDISTEEFVLTKRKIDASNQNRTDKVEDIDELFYKVFSEVDRSENARMNSETPGWLLDRLSILELKIYHFMEQAERKDADTEHRDKAAAKLEVLLQQENDLSICFNELMLDLSRGDKYMKMYKQMKMYNDPSLNPELYKSKV